MRPVPARITLALDSIGAEGLWVDEALGGKEPMVDMWEAGTLVPTGVQLAALAKLTGYPVEFFFRPAEEIVQGRMFICQRGRPRPIEGRPPSRLPLTNASLRTRINPCRQ